ncbi:MAG: hypothetical protein HYY05_04480 [Chloroflexi bacterium]|nr:hypothetical protein [Chloroflexota bacterium]
MRSMHVGKASGQPFGVWAKGRLGLARAGVRSMLLGALGILTVLASGCDVFFAPQATPTPQVMIVTATPTRTAPPTATLPPAPPTAVLPSPTPTRVATAVPTATPVRIIIVVTATPTATPEAPTATPVPPTPAGPAPTNTPAPAQFEYTGSIGGTVKNCGLTEIRGTIRDAAGNTVNGQRVRVSWPSGQTTSDASGTPGRYDPGVYDVVLDTESKDGLWRVWMVDGDRQISDQLQVRSTLDCTGDSAANTIIVNFRRNS